MSSKTKIVVLRMKEIIYTAIFIGLAIFLILLFFFMFRSEKEAPAPTAESASPAVYAPGVYSASLSLGRQNVNVEVAVRHLPADERRAKVDAVLALTGLAHASESMPAALSGGMSQRVGLARALAAEPELLLLDEAFSSLDALTRRQLYDEFVRIHAARPVTTVLVTHDVTEAVLLSSRICRLENGVIARTYDNPAPYPRSLATPGLGALSEEILRGFLEEEPLL